MGTKPTPYGALETMMHVLGAESAEREVVHLVFITDGKFEEPHPDAREVLSSIEEHAKRISGRLNVSHIQILPSNSRNSDKERLMDEVKFQGVRSALLKTFNGSPTAGSFEVDTAESLWNALRDVISVIAETDRQGQRVYISSNGKQVNISAPLPVKRIVSVATSPDGQEPTILEKQFRGRSPFRFLKNAWRRLRV